MMTKVEDVAKAIAARDLDEGDGFYDWFALTEEVTDKYLAMARAAIEAMRDPPEHLAKAAEYIGLATYSESEIIACFNAILDAALSHEGK